MEIKFKRDTSFRKQFFVPDSFAHPAKMDAQLLLWIVERYTSEGETILDPMAGSGTMMLACTLGRDVVLVELEGKFVRMCLNNLAEVRMRPQLGYSIGDCRILWGDARDILRAREHPYQDLWLKYPRLDFATIKSMRRHYNLPLQGDARNLEAVVDKCIFSPPYAESVSVNTGGEREAHQEQRAARLKNRGYDPKDYQGGRGRNLQQDWNYGNEPNNIGNLPYGQIDKIVTSPPYTGQLQGSGADAARKRISEGKYKGLRPDVWPSKGNVAGSTFGDGYSRDPDNLGNLPYGNIDAVVTSPPYEGVMDAKRHPVDNLHRAKRHETLYGDDDKQIGNLKSTSYLDAMLQVYQQCHLVLKDAGLMVLVTKNFIRNKQVVRLDTDTIKLCEQAGFTYLERHYRKLPSQSFWRVIYAQKHPEVEKLEHEDVLVFKKVEVQT